MKRRISALLFLLLTAPLARAALVDGVAAVVDGEVITRSQVREKTSLSARTGAADEAARERALESLIEEALVEQEADRLGLRVSDETVDATIDEIRRRNGDMDPESFRSAIAAQGLEWDAYREEIRAQLRRSRVASRVLRSRMQVGDAALREFFLRNVADYREREAVHLYHIQIPAAEGREAAEAVRERAVGGEDFASLARQVSAGPAAADGGDMGRVPLDNLATSVKAVVWDLPEGEVSPVVDLRDGDFHLFFVAERRPGRIPAYEEVRDRVRERYFEDREEDLYRSWIESLKEKARIERKM